MAFKYSWFLGKILLEVMAALLLYLISLRGWHIIFFWVSATRTASSAVSALFEIVSEGKLITEGHAFALKVTPVSKYEVISVRQLSLSWSYMLQLRIQKFCVVLCLKKLCGCLWDTSHSTFFWAEFSCAHLQSQVEITQAPVSHGWDALHLHLCNWAYAEY